MILLDKGFFQSDFFLSKKSCIFANRKRQLFYRRLCKQSEESPGNIEPPYFLTGRCFSEMGTTASATENNRCL